MVVTGYFLRFCPDGAHAEADSEGRRVGLLRRKGCAGAAGQVGRHGGDSDADAPKIHLPRFSGTVICDGIFTFLGRAKGR